MGNNIAQKKRGEYRKRGESTKMIKHINPVKPHTSQCDWCSTYTSKENLTKVNSIMKQFEICPNCYNKFKNHRCIICGNSTEDPTTHQIIEWKGLCEKCTQLVMSGAEQLKFEKEQGVDFETTMEVIPNREQDITNEELNDWLGYGKKFMQSLSHNR